MSQFLAINNISNYINIVKGYTLQGGLMAQRYEQREINNMDNSNNSIIFIEEETITKELNPREISRRYIYAKQITNYSVIDIPYIYTN